MSSKEPPSHTQITQSPIRLTPHTAYYNNFFLLRTPVTVNGQPAQVGSSSGGELTLSCRYPNLSLSLHSVRASLQEVVKNHGVSRVGDVCCEQVPLFPVSFSKEYNLRKFLLHRDTIQQQLGSLFPKLSTSVKLQLFLVTPDIMGKNTQVMEVTLKNHTACMALFKESEMLIRLLVPLSTIQDRSQQDSQSRCVKSFVRVWSVSDSLLPYSGNFCWCKFLYN